MQLLVVNNDAIFEKDSESFIDNRTGTFLIDLLKHTKYLSLFQFKLSFSQSKRMADFNISDKGINIIGVPMKNAKIIAYLKALYIGYATLRKADFAYIFYPGHLSVIMCALAVLQKKPFGMYVRGEKNLSSFLSRIFYKRAKLVLTISPEFTNRIIEFGGRAETIKPMIVYDLNNVISEREYTAKEKYSLLYVGRLELRKGCYDLINSFKKMVDSGVDNIELIMVGDGPEADRMISYTAALGLSQIIKFKGAITDPDRLMQCYLNADLLVFASHDEGFPRVLYEAAIFGLPIATTFVGTIGNLMKDNYNCFELPLKDSEKMSEKIRSIINDYHSVTNIAHNATSTIRGYLSKHKYPHEVQLFNAIISLN